MKKHFVQRGKLSKIFLKMKMIMIPSLKKSLKFRLRTDSASSKITLILLKAIMRIPLILKIT
jgi:hypothetical protein